MIKITETGGNHLRTLVRTSSLHHTDMFSVLVFVTLLWLVCAVFSFVTLWWSVCTWTPETMSRQFMFWTIVPLCLWYVIGEIETSRWAYFIWEIYTVPLNAHCTLNDIAVNVSLCLLSAVMVQPFVVATVWASTTIFGGYLWAYSACPLIVLYMIPSWHLIIFLLFWLSNDSKPFRYYFRNCN